MNIALVTPAPRHSKTGNRVTALRWAGMLRGLGHRVFFSDMIAAPDTELVIALHAGKSIHAIRAAGRRKTPVIVTLTGTDVYGHLPSESLDLAWRIVALQPRALDNLADAHRRKTRVIHQSLSPFTTNPPKGSFDIAVVGHLRPVKDPFRAAEAARSLPARSRIIIRHIGRALSEGMRQRALFEAVTNRRRYRWLGELTRRAVRAQLARCRGMVLSSHAEGGANVVTEAIVGGIPLIATKIAGSVGILGEDYPGYFEVGATQELSRLLLRLEEDPAFGPRLTEHLNRLRPLFEPARECASWRSLLEELSPI